MLHPATNLIKKQMNKKIPATNLLLRFLTRFLTAMLRFLTAMLRFLTQFLTAILKITFKKWEINATTLTSCYTNKKTAHLNIFKK